MGVDSPCINGEIPTKWYIVVVFMAIAGSSRVDLSDLEINVRIALGVKGRRAKVQLKKSQ